MAIKAASRHARSLEESKNLGLYHHSIKHIFKDPNAKSTIKKREVRSKAKGVGRYKDGVLELSKKDIERISATPSENRKGKTSLNQTFGKGKSGKGKKVIKKNKNKR